MSVACAIRAGGEQVKVPRLLSMGTAAHARLSCLPERRGVEILELATNKKGLNLGGNSLVEERLWSTCHRDLTQNLAAVLREPPNFVPAQI